MTTSTRVLDGPDLEALLARVPDELGEDATIVAAHKVRSGGLGGFFAKERFEVVVEVPEAPLVPARPIHAAPVDRSTAAREDFGGILDRLVRDAGADDGPAPFQALDLSALTTGGVDRSADDDVALALPVAVAPPAPRPTPAPTAAVAVHHADVPGALDPEWLRRIGVPDHIARAPQPSRAAALVQLVQIFESAPQPDVLPREAGSIVAVVGARARATKAARRLAVELGCDPDDIVVATGSRNRLPATRCLPSPEAAAEGRRSWRRRSGPTVVAVEAAPGSRHASWACAVLDALDPTMVWAVVDAFRKPEDVVSWTDDLGGVDALAVVGIDETCSPAAVLTTGIPVGFVDGERATPLLWATTVARHLEEAA